MKPKKMRDRFDHAGHRGSYRLLQVRDGNMIRRSRRCSSGRSTATRRCNRVFRNIIAGAAPGPSGTATDRRRRRQHRVAGYRRRRQTVEQLAGAKARGAACSGRVAGIKIAGCLLLLCGKGEKSDRARSVMFLKPRHDLGTFCGHQHCSCPYYRCCGEE